MSVLPISPVPALPNIGMSTADVLASVRTATANINGLITNFNAGGVTETWIEALALALGDDAIEISSGAINGLYAVLESLQQAEYILTATGSALDNKAADVGVYRKAASAAGAADAIAFYPQGSFVSTQTIAAGVILSKPNADPTVPPSLYQTTSNAYLYPGQSQSTLANVICLSAGTTGNAQPGDINAIVSGVAGYTASNVIAISGGLDAEGDDTPNGGLRARALVAIANASQCTVDALAAAALTYPGIVSAVTLDLTTPSFQSPVLGYALVLCDDGTGNLAGTSAITASFVIPQIGSNVNITVANPNAFPVGSSCVATGANAKSLSAIVQGISGSVVTVENVGLVVGNVGDTVTSPGVLTNPNAPALVLFQNDLNSGLWKAAGAQVNVQGSVLLPVIISLNIWCNSAFANSIASQSNIIAAVNAALFAYVNGLPIGAPLTITDIITVVKDVEGVAEVSISSVLLNGANIDLGVANGVVTLVPGQTIRCASINSVTTSSLGIVSYG